MLGKDELTFDVPTLLVDVKGNPINIFNRGPILYQEDWADRRKYKDTMDVGLSIAGIAASIFFLTLLMMLFLILGFDSILEQILFLISGPVLTYAVFRSYKYYVITRSKGPFQICEGGLVVPMIAKGQRILRRAYFVPWSDIETVRISSQNVFGFSLKTVSLRNTSGLTVKFSDYNIEDFMKALLIITKKVPNKLDPSLDIYIGPKEKRKVIPYPLEKESGDWSPRESAGFLIFIIALVNGLGLPLVFEIGEILGVWIVLVFSFIISFLWSRAWISGIV